jgi:hypothetical protein
VDAELGVDGRLGDDAEDPVQGAGDGEVAEDREAGGGARGPRPEALCDVRDEAACVRHVAAHGDVADAEHGEEQRRDHVGARGGRSVGGEDETGRAHDRRHRPDGGDDEERDPQHAEAARAQSGTGLVRHRQL